MGEVRFLCDDMLIGLARWLRAAGYDAVCQPGVADGILVQRAAAEGRILLTSDSRISERNIVRSGVVRCLAVPRGLRNTEALAWVLRQLHLPLRTARCMACGGELHQVAKHAVRDQVPPRSFAAFDEFFRCAACGKIYWHGSHWQRICAAMRAATDASAIREQEA